MMLEQDRGEAFAGLLIDGREVRGELGHQAFVHNPAYPDRTVGSVIEATLADVTAAVDAAHRAFPDWAALSYAQRADFLRLAADRVESGADARIELLVKENGKVRPEAGMDLARLVRRMRGTAELATELGDDAEIVYPRPPVLSRVAYHPIGVAALIIPWNWPLSILGAKLPQALLAGNCVVVKPSPLAPLATMLTLKMIAEVFPPGVVNAITGDGEVGAELVTDPRVRKVDFTGGVAAGRAVMAAASAGLKRLTLELGGNDPALVLADAELTDEVFTNLIRATFMTTGQTCMAVKRLYVHRSRYREVLDGLVDRLNTSKVGDGLDPDSTMGPLISAERKRAVGALIDNARNRGAVVHELGAALDPISFAHGHFLLPSLITEVDHSYAVVTEEQFGPTLPIMPFDDEDQAISLANDSDFGLCSSVWTADTERGLAIARQLHAGTTQINQHGPAGQDDRAPFGGINDSGFGREIGVFGIREFENAHTITIK